MSKFRPHPKPPKARHFVREWRRYRSLSQEALAERIGKSHSAISQLENGRIDYTQGMLEALADALSCEPADLLMRDPTQTESLWSIWDQIKPEVRVQAMRMLKALTDDKAA